MLTHNDLAVPMIRYRPGGAGAGRGA